MEGDVGRRGEVGMRNGGGIEKPVATTTEIASGRHFIDV